jgi:DNA-binding transcriptional ArsR family regulator
MVDSSVYNLDTIFQALSDPTRRSILRSLAKRERAISEVAESYSISLAAVSKHVKVLEKAKLVARRREGNFSYLSLNPDAMLSANNWMQFYQAYWQGRLHALKNHIEKGKQ